MLGDIFLYIFVVVSCLIMSDKLQFDLFGFSVEDLEPLRNRTRYRSSAQECDSNIMSRSDRINARNRVLTARFYYWTELQRRRFDDVLRILADREFFVEERTIQNALLAQDSFLRELCTSKTTRKQLRKMFPGFDWN